MKKLLFLSLVGVFYTEEDDEPGSTDTTINSNAFLMNYHPIHPNYY